MTVAAPLKPGYQAMLVVLIAELEAAVTALMQQPTRARVLRVKAIRREIARVRRGRL